VAISPIAEIVQRSLASAEQRLRDGYADRADATIVGASGRRAPAAAGGFMNREQHRIPVVLDGGREAG
jgi:hypothetical protein